MLKNWDWFNSEHDNGYLKFMQHFKALKIVDLSAGSHFSYHGDHFQNTHFLGSADGIFDPETDEIATTLMKYIRSFIFAS